VNIFRVKQKYKGGNEEESLEDDVNIDKKTIEEYNESDSEHPLNNSIPVENDKLMGENTRYLNELSDISEKIANGDLTIKINEQLLQRDDSIGSLARAMDEMISNFWYLVTKISENADDLLSSSKKLSNNTEEVSVSCEQAASSVQEIASGSQNLSKLSIDSKLAVEGLIKAIDTSVAITKETMEHAVQANGLAEKGGIEASKAVEKMDNIKDSVTSSADIIGELGDKSKQIYNIVDAINKISEQTNLLALNAAIEAARAGDAGRGFAVVAEEVRKLAEESKNATGQINGVITEIIDNVNKAVTSMKKGTKDVEDSGTVINSALSSLDNITKEVSEVSEQIDEIYTAADLQKGLSENVEKSIDEVNDVAQQSSDEAQVVSSSVEETTCAIEQIAEMSQILNTRAKELKQLISTFKVE